MAKRSSTKVEKGKTRKVRSHGSKQKPCCRICNKSGHYASKCPSLAGKLLEAIRKTTNTADIATFLSSNKKAHVAGMLFKPKKTLKRHARGVAWYRSAKSDSCRRREKPAKTMKKSMKKTPRIRKRPLKCKQTRPFTERETMQHYAALKKSGWAWCPKVCHRCGGPVMACTWLESQERGWSSVCFSNETEVPVTLPLAFKHDNLVFTRQRL